ncbi:unnamed protein product [Owenia fusiformis]|uniref:Tyr recombinase domain-containing protein n=1 Tax=Owenia fusiformis TaxID=6347 RepID=A0A8S4Q0C5_OWEFU|nr:unnamed protein product [Owenia fusiformis]
MLATGGLLCPVKAIKDMLCSRKEQYESLSALPLASYMHHGALKTMTQKQFSEMLKGTLDSAGFNAADYSGHSFRRGGACTAFIAGASPLLIKSQGDWRSNAWERYIDIPMESRWTMASLLTQEAGKE